MRGRRPDPAGAINIVSSTPSCAWLGDPHRQDASLRQGQKNLNLLTALRLQFRRQLRTSGAHLSPPSLVSRDPDNLDQPPQKATTLVAFFFSESNGRFLLRPPTI